MAELPTYESHLYRSFKAIDSDSYRSILRFIENHSAELGKLPVREYFDLQYAYVAALYETGAYVRVVSETVELLELSIVHSIVSVGDEDVFRVLLYRRANSLFHLMAYEEAERVVDQLLRIYPEHAPSRQLHERILYQRPNRWVGRGRAASVLLFLASALLIALEVLVVVHFFPDWSQVIMQVRNVAFVTGWVLLLGGDLLHRAWAWMRVSHVASTYQKRRAQKSNA